MPRRTRSSRKPANDKPPYERSATAARKQAGVAIKRRKPGKALEKVARAIKDSDDFVEHIANIADRYRREHELEMGPGARAVRQSINDFRKHAVVLAAWLQQAHKESQAVPQSAALSRIGTALHGAPGPVQAQSNEVQSWLARASEAAEKCIADSRNLPRNAGKNAARLAAEGLRATFEHHKLKFSTQVGRDSQGDAVRVLCAIAKNAGDSSVTPQAARAALVESSGRAPAKAVGG